MTFRQQLLVLSVALGVVGCGSGPAETPPAKPASASTPQGTMHLSGEVKRQSSSGDMPSVLDGAGVQATIDRNCDGSISADETYTTQTDSNGAYALDVPVNPGDTLVVRFAVDGAAPVLRTLKAAPKGNMILDATLRDLEQLQCTGNACSLQRGGATLKGLPPGTRGAARVFNPVTETDAFPGDFNDSNGNLLVSGVFATFELEDEGGNAMHEVPSPVQMRLLVPKDTWDVVRDIAGGNDTIDVPLYWFDEVKGTWVRDDHPGHLEDAQGNVIAPSSLPAIHDGAFIGAVYAVGRVSHFSTWNIDWPIESFGCVSGRILDKAGKPAEGATVTLRGVSYTGTSTPVVLGPDGRFCLEAMRSEAPGEDLDSNGKRGEATKVSIRVVAGEDDYDLGEFEMPSSQGTCGGAGCLNLGDLRIGSANLIKTEWCTIKGIARYSDGAPAANAIVYFWDGTVPEDVLRKMCDQTDLSLLCTLGFADENGAFSVTAPVIRNLTVEAVAGRNRGPGVSDEASALRNFMSCPKEPVSLTLDVNGLAVEFDLLLDGDTISWTPDSFGISELWVSTPSGDVKWKFSRTDGTIPTPVTYGQVPFGATQLLPVTGTPAPLAPGDYVQIIGTGTTIDGLPYYGEGATVR